MFVNFFLFGSLSFYFFGEQAAYLRARGWGIDDPSHLTGWSTCGTIVGFLFLIPLARRFNIGYCILIFNSWGVLLSVPLGNEAVARNVPLFTFLTFLQQITYLGELTLAQAAILEYAPAGLDALFLMLIYDCLGLGSVGPARLIAPWAYGNDIATAQLVRNMMMLLVAAITSLANIARMV